MNYISLSLISVKGRNWHIKHRSVLLFSGKPKTLGPDFWCSRANFIHVNSTFYSISWFLYVFERGYTSLDWWGQRSNSVWLYGYGNCQMLMSVVRVEVSDIRLNLFCLGTFGVFSLYILPSKGKSAWRWDSSSIRSEFLILGFGNIVLSLVAHIAIFSECSWISYLHNYLVKFD